MFLGISSLMESECGGNESQSSGQGEDKNGGDSSGHAAFGSLWGSTAGDPGDDGDIGDTTMDTTDDLNATNGTENDVVDYDEEVIYANSDEDDEDSNNLVVHEGIAASSD